MSSTTQADGNDERHGADWTEDRRHHDEVDRCTVAVHAASCHTWDTTENERQLGVRKQMRIDHGSFRSLIKVSITVFELEDNGVEA